MHFFHVPSLFTLSIVLGTSLGLAQTFPASKSSEATSADAKASVPSQTQKPEKLILVSEGEFYRMYRRLTKEEVKAVAEQEAARQAEIEQEKVRLVQLLLVDQAKVAEEESARQSEVAQELEEKKAEAEPTITAAVQ